MSDCAHACFSSRTHIVPRGGDRQSKDSDDEDLEEGLQVRLLPDDAGSQGIEGAPSGQDPADER